MYIFVLKLQFCELHNHRFKLRYIPYFKPWYQQARVLHENNRIVFLLTYRKRNIAVNPITKYLSRKKIDFP